MRKIYLLLLTAFAFIGCSGDDDSKNVVQDNYSAHMKTHCPDATSGSIYDVCISKAMYDYLDNLRQSTVPTNSCLKVEFEDLDGEVHNDYLIRVEKNQIECN